MDLGPIIRVIENVPVRLPVEREAAPARVPAEPTPRKEAAPVSDHHAAAQAGSVEDDRWVLREAELSFPSLSAVGSYCRVSVTRANGRRTPALSLSMCHCQESVARL